MKTLTLLTELAALTIVVSNTVPYTAHNTSVTILALLTICILQIITQKGEQYTITKIKENVHLQY